MANEKRLIDANALIEALPIVTEDRKITLYGAVADFMIMISAMPTVDAAVLPCKVGDTVYGQFSNYGNKIHKCKVVKSKVCQFRDSTLHYFLDVEFDIIDPYYRDGRKMRCMQQAVFGEDFGSWYRVYRTFEEAAVALAKMDGDGNA